MKQMYIVRACYCLLFILHTTLHRTILSIEFSSSTKFIIILAVWAGKHTRLTILLRRWAECSGNWGRTSNRSILWEIKWMNSFESETGVANRTLFTRLNGPFDAIATENMSANRRLRWTILYFLHAHWTLDGPHRHRFIHWFGQIRRPLHWGRWMVSLASVRWTRFWWA